MSFTVPSRRIAALAVATSGLSAVLAGAFAPAASAAPSTSSTPAVSTVAAKASSWFVDPRTPAQRKAEVAVPKNPKKYTGKVKETRAVYRTRAGELAVPMRYAFGHKVESGQAVTLDGEGLFVVNTVKLTPNAKTQLRRLGEALDNAASIRCEGYADYAGAAARNVVLSRGRAEAVCDAMAAQNAGVRTKTVAYGPTWPAVIGGDSEARRLNRRVVVEVTNAKPVTPPVPPAPQITVPGPPVLEELQTGMGIVGYAFTKPASDGGSPITGYQVTTGDGWAPVSTEVPQLPAAATSACLADCGHDDYLYGFLYDLPVGSTADIRVRAVNKVGAGAPSNTLQTQVQGAPGAPSFATWTGDDGVITTTFDAPEKNGGSPITGYQIAYDGNDPYDLDLDLSVAGPYSSQHEGFQNGTTHVAQVRARNQWGWGPWSSAVNVLVATVPDAPWLDEPELDEEAATATFQLDAPEFDGGSPVTGYKISTDGGDTWGPLQLSGSPASYSFELTDLVLGHEYRVQVRAVNVRGDGEITKTRSFTPALVPSAPTGLEVTGDNGEMKVVFGAPLHDNGADVTSYDVSFDGGQSWAYDVELVGNAPWTFTLEGFTNGQAYDVRVRANNRIGFGAEASADDVLVATAPGTPVVFGIEPADQRADLVFGAPETDGGSEISSYEVSIDGGAWTGLDVTPDVMFPNILRASVADLVNGQKYAVRVRAVNARGNGEASESVDVTPSTVPAAPTNVVATPNGTTVTVSFDKPADGGSAITGYQVRVDSGAWVDATVAEGEITLTNQVVGFHTYAVRAINDRGQSAAGTSAQVEVVQPAPAGPTNVYVVGDGNNGTMQTYNLQWTPGATNGATITGWEARVDDGSWVTVTNVEPIASMGIAIGDIQVPCNGACGRNYTVIYLRGVLAGGGYTPVGETPPAPASSGDEEEGDSGAGTEIPG